MKLSDMQREVYTHVEAGESICLTSPTGSGKTLAFLLPLMETRLQETLPLLQVVVIEPTRELAQQCYSVTKDVTSFSLRAGAHAHTLCVHGGHSVKEDVKRLSGAPVQLIVGTPGRLQDLLEGGHLNLADDVILVVDEYDKCAELGFEEQMHAIYQQLPVKQLVLVSATSNEEGKSLDEALGFKQILVPLVFEEDENRIEIERIETTDKTATLLRLLSKGAKSIVFMGQRERARNLGEELKKAGITSSVYHGGLEQEDRERALFRFTADAAQVLVATDIAARGLDIADVDLIVHYDRPEDETVFIHRNGRTARWDKTGRVVALVRTDLEEKPYGFDEKIGGISPQNRTDFFRTSIMYIGKGKKDKISKGDVVGFLCQQCGAQREDIGQILLQAHTTHVALNIRRAQQICKAAQDKKIKNQKTLYKLWK